MDVTIYGSRISPFVEKVIRGVQHKGCAWKLVVPKRRTDMQKWNPWTGKMPAVDVGDERLFDSTFILRRLDELVPTPSLVSSDPNVAARQRQLEDWADEALHWNIMALRWSPSNGHASANRILDEIDAPSLLRPIIARAMRGNARKRALGQGIARVPEALLTSELAERLDDLVRILGDSAFFFGDTPSVADCAVFGQLTYANVEVSPETRAAIQARPKLLEYMQRVDLTMNESPSDGGR
jgi:glutathione S-transferase